MKRLKIGIIAGTLVLCVTGTILGIRKNLKKEEPVEPVIKKVEIKDEYIPVVNTDIILKPFNSDSVSISETYYEYNASEDDQVNSIINYKNTYMQSTGVCYGSDEEFSVISILPGTVTDVKEDELLGKIVEIKHTNNVVSVYQSLGNVFVEKNQYVDFGYEIGRSGTSEINKTDKNNLYFELIIDGANVNPELYYSKKVTEI